MNKAFGRDTTYVTTIGLSQIAGAQFLHVYKPRNWINCGQAGPLGWTLPAALGVRAADPDADIVALSGDYDFQFMIEELAVGAQHRLPYIHVVVNNAYLGLIRQAQRGFSMDFEVSLAFENINRAGDAEAGYGVDHVAVAEAMGCKAVRVRRPEEFAAAFKEAKRLMKEHPGSGRAGIHPGARHQHFDGHGDRQGHRIRGTCREATRTRRPRSSCSDLRSPREPRCRAFPPTCRCSSPSMSSSTASTRPPAPASRASNISGPTIIAPEVVAARLKKNGLTQVLFNLPPGDWAKGERGIAVLPDRVDEFRSGVDTAITYAKALGCGQVNCLAGIAPARRRSRPSWRTSSSTI